jgi:dihydropteroate synthase
VTVLALSGMPAALAGLRRTVVMGVLNVTPDSFSDGGLFVDVDVAVEHARSQVAQGADLVDVGGESTRPGATRIPVSEELDRVLPVIRELAAAGVIVSIDTMRAEVAREAVAVGAAIVNDVSGGLADPQMLELLTELDVPYVAMHWRGHSADMDQLARYDDVVSDVRAELADRLVALNRAGVDLRRVVLDPGLGFAKTAAHNWQLLRGLSELTSLGRPLLLGASRKRFLGELLADSSGPRPVTGRDRATDAVTALAAARGVWGVRVHDAGGSRDAIEVARSWPIADVAAGQPSGYSSHRGPSAHGSGPASGRGATETGPDRGSPHGTGAASTTGGARPAWGDRIVLTGVRAWGHHGVFEHERAEGQEFVVDVVLDLGSIASAAEHDDLGRTVDYGLVAETLVALIEGPPVDLVETLAESMAQRCLSFSGVRSVDLTLHKPQAPIRVPFGDVAVRVVRRR